jgi:hypothetical protein
VILETVFPEGALVIYGTRNVASNAMAEEGCIMGGKDIVREW